MDFLILFLFADFLSENPSNFTEFNVKCKKSAKSWISNFTYFIWVGSLRNNALGVIRGPIFETWVWFRGCVPPQLNWTLKFSKNVFPPPLEI